MKILGYQIEEKLYESEHSLIYRGQREADNMPVVLKLLNYEYPRPEQLARFRREYRTTRDLDLKGIIQAYDLKNHKNTLVMVLEDFGGRSLAEELPYSHLDIEDFLKLSQRVTEILGRVHHANIIHKDINPSNILRCISTQEVKLIDFGISTELSRETQAILNPVVLEGTLAYMSPEQTGRVNRTIDYRTDFYSLGVTFYEMLTGQLPHQAEDAMELVHCHIAKAPATPHEINPQIPTVLSAIVLKLLAKNAEDRYQSAFGVGADLSLCLEQYRSGQNIEFFPIGRRDTSEAFQIPQKLYGRSRQVKTLLETFDRVSQGATEMCLVAGYSGIGKSALVNEVHKPIVKQRGYFISGKFDQFQRNIPYVSLIQAFKELIRQLLTESDHQIKIWKEKLVKSLGQAGQVIVEVIPEVEVIIGPQPAVAELGPTESQNRFNSQFREFVRTFAAKDHPLIIFLDDLQWADGPSLQLIELLITDPEEQYIFLIGAYRDNEVDAAHPLTFTLTEIEKTGAHLNTITLQALELKYINQLIAETLNSTLTQSRSLAELCLEKTGGNPFFLNQFLHTLHEERLLQFDPVSGVWKWEMEQIRQAAMTDNVVELMTEKLRTLPESTQKVLKLAACIGNRFDLYILSIVNEQSPDNTATEIWLALKEGLILPLNDLYKFVQDEDPSKIQYCFLHDRVQQAAYALIEEVRKKKAHQQIGQLLLQHISKEELEEKIFDIVNHLNFGSDYLKNQTEKYQLAVLNLKAGEKARLSVAFEPALKYFTEGVGLLPKNSWEKEYELTSHLYFGKAEVEFVTGNLEEGKRLLSLILPHTNNLFDHIKTYTRLTDIYSITGEIHKGTLKILEALHFVGVDIPTEDAAIRIAIDSELQQIEEYLLGIEIAGLYNLPEMQDVQKQESLPLLFNLWALAYLSTNLSYITLSTLKAVHISLKNGNSKNSAFGYTLYGLILRNQENYEAAYEFGSLALKLNEKFKNVNIIAKTHNIFGHAINPYRNHLRDNIAIYRRGYEGAMQCGDVIYSVWALHFIILTRYTLGDPLEDLVQASVPFVSRIKESKDPNIIRLFLALRQTILNLQGKTKDLFEFDSDDFKEKEALQTWQDNHFDVGINWFSYLKLQVFFLYGNFSEAIHLGKEMENFLPANFGFWPVVKYHFFYCLSLAQLYARIAQDEQELFLEKMKAHQAQMRIWADKCPENFLHKYLLMTAEIRRVQGDFWEASDLYEQAITVARQDGYLQNEALANELAGEFYLLKHREKAARGYLTEARYLYIRWGAHRKVEIMDEKYSHLLFQTAEGRNQTTPLFFNTI